MLTRWTTALALCVMLGACGGSKQSADNSNRNFDERFVASCVQSATSGGVPEAIASKICACASGKVRQRYSMQEIARLTQQQVKPIMVECKASITG
jgi:hypothetical protein